MTKLAEILSGPETWGQGWYVTEGGQLCLVGALRISLGHSALDDDFDDGEYIDRLVRAIWESTDDPYKSSVPEWNDRPGRTWSDIEAVVETYDRLCLLDDQPKAAP